MTQTTKTILISILCSVAVMFTLANWMGWGNVSAPAAKQESVYDRVMRTKTIRCGYFIRAGFLMKDVNSGELSGIAHDYAEDLAKSLSLKIEWTAEIGGGDIATALDSGRIDAYCSAVWPTSARARAMDFVSPIATTPLLVLVRADDNRFTSYDDLNDPKLKASYVDGTTMALVTMRRFNKAQAISLPQLSALSEPLVELAGGKADFALSDAYVGMDYMAKNPGKLKIFNIDHPVGKYTNAIFIKQDEYKFKRMLDVATQELILTGVVDHIIKRYDRYPGSILPIISPVS